MEREETINIHCRNCVVEKPPYIPSRYSYDYRLWEELTRRGKLRSISPCRFLKLHSDSILAFGPDSFVIKSSDGNFVYKLYPKHSEEQILGYQKRIKEFKEEHDGKLVPFNGLNFAICTVPLLRVYRQDNCVFGVSDYIPGENEYDRYLREAREYEEKHKGLQNFRLLDCEKELKEVVGVYIDPRNYKLDIDNELLFITDIECRII